MQQAPMQVQQPMQGQQQQQQQRGPGPPPMPFPMQQQQQLQQHKQQQQKQQPQMKGSSKVRSSSCATSVTSVASDGTGRTDRTERGSKKRNHDGNGKVIKREIEDGASIGTVGPSSGSTLMVRRSMSSASASTTATAGITQSNGGITTPEKVGARGEDDDEVEGGDEGSKRSSAGVGGGGGVESGAHQQQQIHRPMSPQHHSSSVPGRPPRADHARQPALSQNMSPFFADIKAAPRHRRTYSSSSTASSLSVGGMSMSSYGECSSPLKIIVLDCHMMSYFMNAEKLFKYESFGFVLFFSFYQCISPFIPFYSPW